MELGGRLKAEAWDPNRVPTSTLASIISHVLTKQITGRTAKLLLFKIFEEGDPRSIEQIVADENLALQPLSREEYAKLAKEIMEEKPEMVKDVVVKGQWGKVGWFVG